jgi:hypothetical protein
LRGGAKINKDMNPSHLKTAKQHLKNAFTTHTNAYGMNDKPMLYEYLNDVQDSIIKDLPARLTDSEVQRIGDSLANYNVKLRREI